MKEITRKLGLRAQSSGWILAGALTICIPGVLHGQGASEETEAGATMAIKPPQPGRLLQNTISAPPLTKTSSKLLYRAHSFLGPRSILGTALEAAIGQGIDTPHEWGQELRLWSTIRKRHGSESDASGNCVQVGEYVA